MKSENVLSQIRRGHTIASTCLGHLVEDTNQRTLQQKRAAESRAAINKMKDSLFAVAVAIVADQPEEIKTVIDNYHGHCERAWRNTFVLGGTLRKRCEAAYLRCLSASLQSLAYAVIEGDQARQQRAQSYYDHFSAEMLKAGYQEYSIRALMCNRVWGGIR